MSTRTDEPHSLVWGRGLAAALIIVGVVGLVAVVRTPAEVPPPVPRVDLTTKADFGYAAWSRVLKARVNRFGMVDYAAVKAHPQDLEEFLGEVSRYSPDRHLAMFTTEGQGLAYWINAYNAWMMKAVIDGYPVSSVQKIGGRRGAVFTDKSRLCGGLKLSLNDIESRARSFGNPTVHFALNCASLGCPPMSRQPFVPQMLNAQLAHVTRDALSRRWYCHLADGGRTVSVTTIIQWYANDVVAWQRANGKPPAVSAWLSQYSPPPVGKALANGATLQYLPYDWRLNDARARWGHAKRQ